MGDGQVVLISGSRKGLGRFLAQHYADQGHDVIGCSRGPAEYESEHYRHFRVDVSDESNVKRLFSEIRKTYGRLDVLINNAGIASMNHSLLTPGHVAQEIYNTNVVGTFLLSREAAKLMTKRKYGRIVNLGTVATPLKLEGEALYASSKAAVISLTQILAKEFSSFGITINAVGPAPMETDLTRSVPPEKLDKILQLQAISRFGTFSEVAHVIDFFIQPESGFVTGQVIYLGGV